MRSWIRKACLRNRRWRPSVAQFTTTPPIRPPSTGPTAGATTATLSTPTAAPPETAPTQAPAEPAPTPVPEMPKEAQGVIDAGAFRFADRRGNYLEARVDPPGTARVEVRAIDVGGGGEIADTRPANAVPSDTWLQAGAYARRDGAKKRPADDSLGFLPDRARV